ncbi:MAG: GcrA family cell cycle regulator [Rickettsiales bacterium]|jgi:GcrA cell cycle regulator|nr:GcrA family cell cycle regulator [Rickettsiales bacterium]
MATINSWPAGLVARMKKLFDKGLPMAEIGKKLGFSKNAVVGKINRLGWNTLPKRAEAKKKSQKTAKKMPAVKKATPKDAAKSKKNIERTIQHSAQLMSLRADQCRWPIGDPDSDNFRFCGEKCFAGKPYCFEHCKIAYQFTTPPRKR